MEERNRVLQKRPWCFDNQVMVIQPWRPHLRGKDPSFHKVQIWVHIHGLPNHWISKEVGWKLDKLLYKCLNVIYPEHGGKEGKILKLLVDFKLDKTILRGTKIKLEGKIVWVDFKYELLSTFCFYCGILGYSEKGCEQKVDDSTNSQVCEGQFGEWLRANQNKG